MNITMEERTLYKDLAIRLSVAYNSYTLGNKSMDNYRKSHSEDEDNISDYWIKLAMMVQKDMSNNLSTIFFDDK